MDILHTLFNILIHLDQHLIAFVTAYGTYTYLLLFVIIFCETGIIFMAMLPGDSLLFATGALAANVSDVLNINLLFLTLVAASIAGNGLNYTLGKWIGPKVFCSRRSWLLHPKHIEETHQFFEKYGGKTIIIARFLPILRTFAPFIAGVGYMTYRQFFIYSTIGALLWIGTIIYLSYLFGNLPIVKEHFSIVILAIIGLSLLPAIIEIMRRKLSRSTTP